LKRLSETLTPRKAAQLIVLATVLITLAGGIMIWAVDHREFPDLGESLWWSLQTVTTVGYGDVVPKQTGGRFIGAVLMLWGIGFITVIAASVTATLIEQARQRRMGERGATADQLDDLEARLSRIEEAVTRPERPPRE
jgi:voltage-gated potassium channel